MGVNITAFHSAKLVKNPTIEQIDDCILVEAIGEHDFLGGMVNGGIYDAKSHTEISLNCGSFNDWREELAEMTGYKPIHQSVPVDESDAFPNWQVMGRIIERQLLSKRPYMRGAQAVTSGAFWEILNSPDNAGTLGTEVCQKLAKDFEDFAERANQMDSKRFKERYWEFKEMFETAANNGFIHLL